MADIIEYLKSLKNNLDDLYEDPWTCQAVLRSLPPVPKQIVMRMLFAASVPIDIISSWASTPAARKSTIEHLSKLRLLLKSNNPGEPPTLRLNERFQKQIVNAMCSNNQSAFAPEKKPSANQDHVPDATTLDEYARQRWDDVLHFMVGSSLRAPSSFLVDLLVDAELMVWETDERLRMSNKGFKFLLKDVHTQIWALLLKFIDNADTRRVDEGGRGEGGGDGAGPKYVVRKELLSFLLRTSFLTLGQGYPVKELTDTQKTVMNNLREFGLIYMRKDTSHRFYPTRLAISLCSGKAAATPLGHETSKAEQDGFIVLESNYRLYAYLISSYFLLLPSLMLSLFVKMMYKLPSFAMGMITRESVRTALLNGISAEQIISFIQQNVHDQARKRGTPVPETVIDQIRLWESERNRVSYQRGFLYDSFANDQMFRETVQYAKDLSVYMYSNDERRFLMADDAGHERIKAFLKKKYG